MSQKAIFLDRDGVINRVVFRYGSVTSPRGVEEFEFEAGVENAVIRLREAGFRLFAVTNQPEVARGLLTMESLRLMNQRIMTTLALDDMRVCLHDNNDGCRCRKPRSGMLIELARAYDLALGQSYVVGDTWKDACAGREVGCKTIILDRPYNYDDWADWRVPDLSGAVDLILEKDSGACSSEGKCRDVTCS